MTYAKQDKPYKSIDLSFTEMYAVILALRDRESKLVGELAQCRELCGGHVLDEIEGQLVAVRALLVSLKTV